jgi:hypothetical protein
MFGILVHTPIIFLVASDPQRALPPGDPPGYLQLAHNFLTYGVFSMFTTPPFESEIFRTPGYPIFLAGLLSMGGGSLIVVTIVQSLLRVLSGVFLATLATDVLPSPKLGVAAGALWILAPIPAMYAGVIAPETLFAFLFLLALYMLRANSISSAAISGFVIGLAVLVRPIGVILVAGLLPAVWFSRRKGMVQAVLFLCSSALALAPWLIHNYLEFGRPALSSVSGNNLLHYNAASCLGRRTGGDWSSGAALARARYDEYLSTNHLHPSSPVEESDVMGNVALQIIFESPLECAAVTVADGWNTLRPGASYAMLFLRPDFPAESNASSDLSPAMMNLGDSLVFTVSIFLTVWYLVLYVAAVIGIFWIFAQRRWAVILFWLLPMVLLLLAPGIAGNARFRIPIDPGLSLLAVAGLAWTAAWARNRPEKK